MTGEGLRLAGVAQPAREMDPSREQELSRRTARKDGRQVVSLRSVQRGGNCFVECEVYPVSGFQVDPLTRGPYTFASAEQATIFVNEVMEALTVLGCEVS
jgi:hypothetical protein